MAEFLDDAVLQAIAAENNLSETAFLVANGDDYRLRWFTPVPKYRCADMLRWPVRPWSWSDWSRDAAAWYSIRQAGS